MKNALDTIPRRSSDIRVARVFNTYGPRMSSDDGRVVSNFIVQALAAEPLTVYGDGKQTRSFCLPLQTSTSEVYGDPLVHPQPEDYWGNVNPIGIRGVYDEAKRFAEAMTLAYHRTHGVDTRIVRRASLPVHE